MAENLARSLFSVSVDGHINYTLKKNNEYVAVAYYGFYMYLKKETEEILIIRQYLKYLNIQNDNMGYLEWYGAG